MLERLRLIGSRARDQRGQTIIFVALAAFVLFGFLGLALDAGNTYFERRKAQNVADAAALAGASEWSSGAINSATAVTKAREYAGKNGYTTDTGGEGVWVGDPFVGEVKVNVPPDFGTFQGDNRYIQVEVKRTVPTFFAGVMNIFNVDVYAWATATGAGPAYDAATISISPDQDSTYFNGAVNVTIQGDMLSLGGMEVDGTSTLINVTGSGTMADELDDPHDDYNPTAGVYEHVSPLDYPRIPPPAIPASPTGQCRNNGDPCEFPVTGLPPGSVVLQPGHYTQMRLLSSFGDTFYLKPGVYAVDGDVTIGAGVTITSEYPAGSYNPVIFYMLGSSSQFDVAGDATIKLWSDHTPTYPFHNVAIYSNSCHPSQPAVKIRGTSASRINGTIYAPCGMVSLGGTSGELIHGQVIGWQIEFFGTNSTTVVYDPDNAPEHMGPILVEPAH